MEAWIYPISYIVLQMHAYYLSSSSNRIWCKFTEHIIDIPWTYCNLVERLFVTKLKVSALNTKLSKQEEYYMAIQIPFGEMNTLYIYT